MKTFIEYLFENQNLPLFMSIDENSIIINKDKWNEIFKDKKSFVVDGNLLTFGLKDGGDEGIPARFLDESFPTQMLVISNIPDDPLARSSASTARTGRFPRRQTRAGTPYKKEVGLAKNLIIFGKPYEKEDTHALKIPLEKISLALEDPEQRAIEPAVVKDDYSSEVRSILSGMTTVKSLGNSDFVFKQDPRFLNKLVLLIDRVFDPDHKQEVSNIHSIKVLRIPPKNKMLEEFNKVIGKIGSKEQIVDFSNVQPSVEKALTLMFGISNPKEILDQVGERYYYVFLIGGMGPKVIAIPPREFYKKYYKILNDKNWSQIEDKFRSPSRENSELLIRIFKKYGIIFKEKLF